MVTEEVAKDMIDAIFFADTIQGVTNVSNLKENSRTSIDELITKHIHCQECMV